MNEVDEINYQSVSTNAKKLLDTQTDTVELLRGLSRGQVTDVKALTKAAAPNSGGSPALENSRSIMSTMSNCCSVRGFCI